MKKFFDTNENIADKAFTQSIVISVVGILLCIVALCSATYAWFAADISSSKNTISAAFFDLDVQVVQMPQSSSIQTAAVDEGEPAGSEPPATPAPKVLTLNNGEYLLEAGYTYRVTLTIPAAVTASKGYCDIFELAKGGIYRTEYIENSGEKTFCFDIVANEQLRVVFVPKWGTAVSDSALPITSNASITVGTPPSQSAATEPDADSSEGTTPDNTEGTADPENNAE